ncbi:hypothetical protein [Halovulum sp. GXIMD14793]
MAKKNDTLRNGRTPRMNRARLLLQEKPTRRPRRRRVHRHGWIAKIWHVAVREFSSILAKIMSFAVFAALFLLLFLDGSQVAVPWFNRLVNVMGGPATEDVTIGDVEFALGRGDVPAGLTLKDVVLNSGDVSVVLPKVETSFTMLNGIQGLVRPKSIEVSGTKLRFIRNRQNQFAMLTPTGRSVVLFGADTDMTAQPDLSLLFGQLADLDKFAVLEELDYVRLDDITVSFADQRSGRRWTSLDAQAEFQRKDGRLIASLDASLAAGQGDAPMRVSVRMSASQTDGGTRITASFEDVPPADLATQVGVLDWMDVIEGRVSGNLALSYDQTATLTDMSGVLDLGPGKIEPQPGRSIGFDGAKGYWRYDPRADVIHLDGLTVDTLFGGLTADGRVSPKRDQSGGIAALVGQLHLSRLDIEVPEYLARPLTFEDGRATARVAFDPFRIDIGEALLHKGSSRIALSGRVKPEALHWDVALDGQVGDIGFEDAMALWPATFRPNLRRWLDKHVEAGRLTSLAAHVRTPDGRPEIGLDFSYAGASVRVLDTMPAIRAGVGRGTLLGNRLSIALRQGYSETGTGRIDLAGSRFVVPDTRIDKAPAIALVQAQGAIPDLLHVINLPPLGLMDRFGRAPDLVEGQAVVAAELGFELRKDLKARDVRASVTADLQGVTSDQIVPGRVLAADAITLAADNDGMRISGPVRLSEVPMRITYAQEFGEGADPGRIDGSMSLTNAHLAGLGIGLPKGMVGGSGKARFEIALRNGAPPRYSVTAGLGGNSLALPSLGWRKRAGPAARIAMSGALSTPVTIEKMDFSGPGLSAKGSLTLSAAGLRRASLSRLRIGGWLDAPVDWDPVANRASVRGGTIDMRRGGAGGGSGTGGGGSVKLSLTPDRVIVSDGIVLTGFRGDLTTGQRSRGRFTARVNGRSKVSGVIQPGEAIFIEGRDGGAVLRDAGLFENARGGTLRISLKPLGKGVYDGRFSLQKTRVTGAPVLAEMLSIISVFGLVNRLGGEGIYFDDVQGWFTLSDDRLVVTRSRAVGASMGITLSGSYQLDNDRLDMQGVLSPLYFVNGLPGRIFGLGRLLGGRDGEGLFGASFRITGKANAPRTSINPLSVLTPGAARELFMSRQDLRPTRN